MVKIKLKKNSLLEFSGSYSENSLIFIIAELLLLLLVELAFTGPNKEFKFEEFIFEFTLNIFDWSCCCCWTCGWFESNANWDMKLFWKKLLLLAVEAGAAKLDPIGPIPILLLLFSETWFDKLNELPLLLLLLALLLLLLLK